MMRRLILWLALLTPAAAFGADCPSPPTKPTQGVPCTDASTGYTITRLTDHASDVPASTWASPEYSRKQGFNVDGTLALVMGSQGKWHLYNPATSAYIKLANGLAGDCEPQWNPTDPNKLWFLPINGGLVIKELNVTTDAVTTVVDFTGRLPWPTAARVWTRAEGSPSKNGRYWAFMAETSGFSMLGFFTFDMQTDTILATKTATARPDHVSMLPSGDYMEIEWTSGQLIDGIAGRKRVYTRDLTDWSWLDCWPNHGDFAEGLNGHDIYMAIDYTNGGAPACSPANGYTFIKDVQSGFVSEDYMTGRIDLFPTYVSGTTMASHFSGRAFSLPGYMFMSTYTALTSGLQPKHNKLMLIPLQASPTIQTLASTENQFVSGSYFTEAHSSISRDGTKIMFGSNWDLGQSADADVDVYLLDVALPLSITSTTLPNGTVGQSYPDCVIATGGTAPRTFSLAIGSDPLPTGLTLTSDGCFTGTASSAATFTPTFLVTDDEAATDDQQISWVVNSALQIDTTSLPDGTNGSGYSSCIEASGGTAPRTFGLAPGSNPVPTGLTLESTGCFSGTITAAAVFSFTARVTDDAAATDDQALSITTTSAGGGGLAIDVPIIDPLDTAVLIGVRVPDLDFNSDCFVTLFDALGSEFDTATSLSGPARRNLVVEGLTAETLYSATVSCEGTQVALPLPFVTRATPSVGARTVPVSFGAPPGILSTAARITVDVDDNEALSSPTNVQNTSCAAACDVDLSLSAGLYYYRWRRQSAADAVLATSPVQPLVVP